MKRVAIFLAALMPLSLLSAQNDTERDRNTRAIALMQQQAIQINELAGKPQTIDDSRKLIDLIAETFAKELPPAWATRAIQDRVAHAEFDSAHSPAKLIPEKLVVEAWNRYMQTIGAPQETLVSEAEIHNLRDGAYSTALEMWNRGSRSVWTMPNIYATGPDEKVAAGCTAVEAIRVLWSLSNMFENLRAARERVKQGILVSDTLKRLAAEAPSTPRHNRVEVSVSTRDNPVEAAEIRYVREHGIIALDHAIEVLLYDIFPSQT